MSLWRASSHGLGCWLDVVWPQILHRPHNTNDTLDSPTGHSAARLGTYWVCRPRNILRQVWAVLIISLILILCSVCFLEDLYLPAGMLVLQLHRGNIGIFALRGQQTILIIDFCHPMQCISVAFAMAMWLSVCHIDELCQTMESVVMWPSHSSFSIPNMNSTARRDWQHLMWEGKQKLEN